MTDDGPVNPIFVVSAPSGVGKTTLNRKLANNHPHFEVARSLTTRPIRAEERHGDDYLFVKVDEFKRAISNGELLEWAEVHGNFYGTSKEQIAEIERRGHFSILEIDVQGWKQAKPKLKRPHSIFILPPSFRELWDRLEQRGTDDERIRLRRFDNAVSEIKNATSYDSFIVNDSLEFAYSQLKNIIVNGKADGLSPSHGAKHIKKLLEEYETSDWLVGVRQRNSQ